MFMQGKGNTKRSTEATKTYTQIELENARNGAQFTKKTKVIDQEIDGEQTKIVKEQSNLSQYSLARDRQRTVIIPSIGMLKLTI